jgi:hypothetical protein
MLGRMSTADAPLRPPASHWSPSRLNRGSGVYPVAIPPLLLGQPIGPIGSACKPTGTGWPTMLRGVPGKARGCSRGWVSVGAVAGIGGGGYSGPQRRYLRACCHRDGQEYGGSGCQEVGGAALDAAVAPERLQGHRPERRGLAFDALEPLEPEPDALANQGQLGLERSRVAAPRAQRQYHSVAPETRLVARSLEPRWEAKLRAVEVVEPQDQTWRQPHPAESTAAERHEILAIGENLPAVWQAPTTTMADRKHLLRLSIKPVRVDRHRVGGKWWFQSTWQTGASSRQALTRYDIGDQASGDGEQLETRTRQLHAAQHPDKHIAARRKAAGSRPPDGGTCRFQNSGHLGQRWGLVKINAGAMTPARFRGGAGADTIRGILQPLSVSKAPV